MKIDKIKVNKQVKCDLDYMLSHKDKFFILNKHINEGWAFKTSLNSLSVEEMSKALNIGYELEKTPEEEILEVYKSASEGNPFGFDDGYKSGILKCLETLNIKIKGINT